MVIGFQTKAIIVLLETKRLVIGFQCEVMNTNAQMLTKLLHLSYRAHNKYVSSCLSLKVELVVGTIADLTKHIDFYYLDVIDLG